MFSSPYRALGIVTCGAALFCLFLGYSALTDSAWRVNVQSAGLVGAGVALLTLGAWWILRCLEEDEEELTIADCLDAADVVNEIRLG